MLVRLYVDNFRTFTNFDIALKPLTLLLGPNGAGKSTVFDIIHRLRQFVCGDRTASDLFPASTVTRWQQRSMQSFELVMKEQSEIYTYHLEIDHDLAQQRCRVKAERLLWKTQPLFESRLEGMGLHAQLYRDNASRGPEVLADWTRSGVGCIAPRHDNQKLTRFRQALERVHVCRFDPMVMSARSEQESGLLGADAANFVDWLRHATALDLELITRVRPMIEEAILAYDGLGLVPDGEEAKVLKVKFRADASEDASTQSYECRFDELSDGQRMLIVLYSLLAAARNGATLCLDEPENFLALREIQPWLDALIERTQAGDCQGVLVSHHPHLIDALAKGQGQWLDRIAGGPTRCQPVTDDGSGLAVSELVARGWLHV
jgi:predicted ATPase